MIDGIVARTTHTDSDFGSKLDSAADLVYVSVCLVKLLPVLRIGPWMTVWIAVIAIIKIMHPTVLRKRFRRNI